MRLYQIVEAEVDPKTGEIHRWVDRDKLLQKYAGDKSVFVHFSDVNKLGLNPSSTFGTPIGIYAYPVDYVLGRPFIQIIPNSIVVKPDKIRMFQVPFAGDRDFIIVFRVKDLTKCWEVHGAKDVVVRKNIVNLIRGWVKAINRKVKIVDDDGEPIDKYESDWIDECYGLIDRNLRWISNEIKLPGFPEADRLAEAIGLNNSQLNAVKFLTVAYNCMHRKWVVSSPDDLLWKLCRTVGYFSSKNQSVGWSKVLLKLGYNGVIDDGNGIIHYAEPTQAVFFRSADLEHLETIKNRLDIGSNVREVPGTIIGHKDFRLVPSTRAGRSVNALIARSGEIPHRVYEIIKSLGFGANTHFTYLISKCSDVSQNLDQGVGRHDFLNDYILWFKDEFNQYRESLTIFRKNAPEAYSKLRSKILRALLEQNSRLRISSDEQMAPVAIAFNKLMRSV